MAATIAVAADRLTSTSLSVTTRVATGADISEFVAPIGFDSMIPPIRTPVRIDPFDATDAERFDSPVASWPASPTVRTPSSGGRLLTAILVADDRRIAVIDDAVVGVGDVLPDGARVSAIQPNRVFVVDSKGRWHTLTLTNRGQ